MDWMSQEVFCILNIQDRIKAIDVEYSESEIFLEYGLPSLMLYEPVPA